MDDQAYEITIKRFLQSTDFQLKKLIDCTNRLNEFQGYEDWANVKQAHYNVSEILKRIKADVKEMERFRKEIVASLDDKSSNLTVNKIDEQLKDVIRKLLRQMDEIESIGAPYHRFALKNQNYILEANIAGPEMYSYELQTNEYIAQDKGLCNAYEQMQLDCENVKKAIQNLSNEINKPKSTIDSVERNIVDGQENVRIEGSSSTAVGYRALGTAIGGALIGTLIAGPIGFLAGAKLGAVAGLGGGVVGFFTTRYFKK